MNLQELTKNKPLLFALLAAGGLGLFTLVQRQKSAGSAGTGQPGLQTFSGAGTGYLDSTATDVAGSLSQFAGQLEQYGNTLTGAVDSLKALQGTNNGGTTPTVLPSIRKITPTEGTWLKDVMINERVDLPTLYKLNPDLDSMLSWASARGYDPAGGVQVFSTVPHPINVPA